MCLVLAILPMRHTDTAAEFVPKIMEICKKLGIRIRLLMADREFFSAECIDSLVRMDVPHLIPCKNTDRTVQRIREYGSGTAGRTSEMILTSADKSVPYTMTVVKRKNVRASATLPEERLIGFASNVPGIDVELYAR